MLFWAIVFDIAPLMLSRHVHYVHPAYHVLAPLIKHMLPVKCMFLLSVYFLTATSYKRMCLTTSFYGMCYKWDQEYNVRRARTLTKKTAEAQA